MTDVGGQGSAFDLAFLLLQGIGAALWVLGLAALAIRPATPRWIAAALGLQLTLSVLLPIGWQVGFPPQSGIDGAARVLVGAPTALGNGLLGVAFGLIGGRQTVGAWRAGWPFLAAFGGSAAVWVAILFS